jgi:hypothetical protein
MNPEQRAEAASSLRAGARTATQVSTTPFELRALEMTEKHFAFHRSLDDAKAMRAHALIEDAHGEMFFVHLGALFNESLGATGKDMAVAFIRELGAGMPATAVAFVTEAWMLLVDQSEVSGVPGWREGSVHGHPERVEAVIVTVEEFGGGTIAMHAPIQRDEKGRSLGGWTRLVRGEGRFVDLLRPPVAQA